MIIYRILNKVNNKSYIGSTETSFNERYRHGKWWKWSHSLHLKSAVKKYGLENFEVSFVWEGETTKEGLIEKEREAILEFDSMIPNGYNLMFGGKSSKTPTHVKTYDLIDKGGRELTVKNLSQFCRENGLNYGAMLNMVSGINRSSQGYALKGTDPSKITVLEKIIKLENIFSNEIVEFERGSRENKEFMEKEGINMPTINNLLTVDTRVSKTGWKRFGSGGTIENYSGPRYKATFYHTDGRVVEVDNFYRFCQENNLNRSSFYNMVNGKALVSNGWSLYPDEEKLKDKQARQRGRKITMKSPDGEEVEIKNISHFCRKHGFNSNSFFPWLRGDKKTSFNGWNFVK